MDPLVCRMTLGLIPMEAKTFWAMVRRMSLSCNESGSSDLGNNPQLLGCIVVGDTECDDAAGADPVYRLGQLLDVGGKDIPARDDDDVLESSADGDFAGFGEVSEVAGVQPSVFVDGRDVAV